MWKGSSYISVCVTSHVLGRPLAMGKGSSYISVCVTSHVLGRPLAMGWSGRSVVTWLGLASARQAGKTQWGSLILSVIVPSAAVSLVKEGVRGVSRLIAV